MARLLGLTFAAIGAMLFLAQGIGTRHPLGASAGAVPVPATPDPSPWDIRPSATPGAGDRGLAQPVMLTRDRTGQFRIDAMVNGQTAEFLVDTGADLVALPAAEAERLGIRVDGSEYRPMLQTASGTANGAPVHIDRLYVANTELDNVDAVVVEGLQINLLGQSVLRRLGKVELQGDAMVLRPN
jgi:aspartyl protease family protein